MFRFMLTLRSLLQVPPSLCILIKEHLEDSQDRGTLPGNLETVFAKAPAGGVT